jgi:hypothetical protein
MLLCTPSSITIKKNSKKAQETKMDGGKRDYLTLKSFCTESETMSEKTVHKMIENTCNIFWKWVNVH